MQHCKKGRLRNAAQNDPLNKNLIAKGECWQHKQLSYHAEFDHIPVSQYPNDRFMDITNALYQHGTKVPVVFLQVLLCYSASFLILDITTALAVLLIRVLKNPDPLHSKNDKTWWLVRVGGSLEAHLTSGADVPGSNLASPKMILMRCRIIVL